jgi:hypothetical protein
MTDERIAKARLSDEKHPELLEALESASEGSTISDVVRESLRTHLLDETDVEVPEDLPEAARAGLAALREQLNGSSGALEVDVARTKVAAATNIPKESVRSAVFGPLREARKIGVSRNHWQPLIVVHPPGIVDDAEPDELEPDPLDVEQPEPTTEERLAKYERAGVEPPEELVATDGGESE